MKVKTQFAIALALFAAAQLDAAPRCSGTVLRSIDVSSGQRFELPIVAVPGANDYIVERSVAWSVVGAEVFPTYGERTTRRLTTASGAAPSLADTLYNSDAELNFALYYTVTAAHGSDSSFKPCSQDFLVGVTPDPGLARDSARIVVPVVGTLRGANNSIFRTRVTLQNPWAQEIGGTLVFRGTAGGAVRSLRFTLPPNATKVYDDVVSATGGDGLGSLDVVADRTQYGYPAPRVTAELQSLAAAGAYGTDVPAITFDDEYSGAVWSASTASLRIADTATKRHNIGIRTLGDDVTITFLHESSEGVQKATVERSYTADYHVQMPLSALTTAPIAEGDVIRLIARRKNGVSGGAIVYLAATDNSTNDVHIEIPTKPHDSLGQGIIVCSNGEGCQSILR